MPDRSVASGAVVEPAREVRLKEAAKSGQGQACPPLFLADFDETRVGQQRERDVMMPSALGASFEVVETELVLQLLAGVFDLPAILDHPDKVLFERIRMDRLCHSLIAVYGRFAERILGCQHHHERSTTCRVRGEPRVRPVRFGGAHIGAGQPRPGRRPRYYDPIPRHLTGGNWLAEPGIRR